MTLPNEKIMEKAVVTADAIATNGKLNDAQANKFIDYVINETVLAQNARVVRFRNESLDIDKIGVGSRAAVPKAEAIDPGVRRGINTSKVTITPSEIMVPFEIGDTFRAVNLEGATIEEHIIRMFATQFANDLEELYILGNQLGPAVLEGDILDGGSTTQHVKDSYLALQNGWSKLGDSGNVVNAANANIGLGVFGQALRGLPTKFRRNKKNLRFFLAPDLAQLYMEKLSTRATNLGDSAAAGSGISPYGVPLVETPLWDFLPKVVEHIVLPGTTAVALQNTNVTNVVVHIEALTGVPTTPLVLDTDYSLQAAVGTVTRIGGAIGDGDTVKVTYNATPQMLLTHMLNFILGIGMDIRIEKDRDIFKGVNQYAITAKVGVQFEEATALVKVKNIGTGV